MVTFFLCSVGVIRLERTTPCTPCKCAKPTAPHPELSRPQKYTFFNMVVLLINFFCNTLINAIFAAHFLTLTI